MKNVKKTKRAVSVIVWAAAILILFWWTAPEQKVDRFVAKNAETLEEALNEDLSGDYSQGAGVQYTCWGQEGEHDVPLGFQNTAVTLVPDGENRWTWQAEGDNRGTTKKISDKWYYFEAWL